MAENRFCTQNDCYREGRRLDGVSYLIVHSPAVYPTVIRAVSGKNNWFDRWNRPGLPKLVHGFIDDTGVYNFAPYTMSCWQIGDGWGNRNCIGYELCELSDKSEFDRVWEHAAVHYAWLCRKYGLGVGSILGHYEAHDRGFASNHSDPAPYFNRFGKTMEEFRSAVQTKLDGEADRESEEAAESAAVQKTYVPWAYGRVTGLEAGDLLNVRTGPSVSEPNVAALPRLAEGNEVDVTALYDNGWAKIQIRGIEGFVNAHYLDITERAGTYESWVGMAAGLGGMRLNVRTGPGTSYDLLAEWPKLGEGNLVAVTGERGDWYQIRIAGQYTGWVSKAYIKEA